MRGWNLGLPKIEYYRLKHWTLRKCFWYKINSIAKRTTLQTQIIRGNKNPSWNAWLDLGGRKSWQYIEITVRDKDLIFDDTVIATQSFSIHPGYHRGLQHCNNAQCSRHLVFDYSLILDGNECRPNRCVRGTCTDLISDYRCNCPSGYGGKCCESRVGIISEKLCIYARYGTELYTARTNVRKRCDTGYIYFDYYFQD